MKSLLTGPSFVEICFRKQPGRLKTLTGPCNGAVIIVSPEMLLGNPAETNQKNMPSVYMEAYFFI